MACQDKDGRGRMINKLEAEHTGAAAAGPVAVSLQIPCSGSPNETCVQHGFCFGMPWGCFYDGEWAPRCYVFHVARPTKKVGCSYAVMHKPGGDRHCN